MNGFKIAMLIWVGVSTLATIASVGKRREVVTAGAAAVITVLNGVFAWLVVNA